MGEALCNGLRWKGQTSAGDSAKYSILKAPDNDTFIMDVNILTSEPDKYDESYKPVRTFRGKTLLNHHSAFQGDTILEFARSVLMLRAKEAE